MVDLRSVRDGSTARLRPVRLFFALCANPPARALSRAEDLGIFAPPGQWRSGLIIGPLMLLGRSRLELPAQPELEPGWREIRAELRRVVGDSTYDIWLSPLRVKAWDGQTLVLEGPASTHAWVVRRFSRILESSARAVLDGLDRVDLEPTGHSGSTGHNGSTGHTGLPGPHGPGGSIRAQPTTTRPDLNA